MKSFEEILTLAAPELEKLINENPGEIERVVLNETGGDPDMIFHLVEQTYAALDANTNSGNTAANVEGHPEDWRPEGFRQLSEALKNGWESPAMRTSGKKDAPATSKGIADGKQPLIKLLWKLLAKLKDAMFKHSGYKAKFNDLFPALKYSLYDHDKACGICRHLEGKTFPSGHIIWNIIRPQLHNQCHCAIIPIPFSAFKHADDPDAEIEELKKQEIENIEWSVVPWRLMRYGFLKRSQIKKRNYKNPDQIKRAPRIRIYDPYLSVYMEENK